MSSKDVTFSNPMRTRRAQFAGEGMPCCQCRYSLDVYSFVQKPTGFAFVCCGSSCFGVEIGSLDAFGGELSCNIPAAVVDFFCDARKTETYSLVL